MAKYDKYTVGSHGCGIWADGVMLMAPDVLMLLEQRDALYKACVDILVSVDSNQGLVPQVVVQEMYKAMSVSTL